MIILSIKALYHIFVNISIALLIFNHRVRNFMDVKKHEEGWALNTHPSYSPIFILTQWQKEGFSHQLHSESEAVGEGVALGNAVHLVHAVLKFFKDLLLLICECSVQILAIPDNQLQEFLQPFVATSALLEGRYVSVPEFVNDIHIVSTSCQHTTIPQKREKVQTFFENKNTFSPSLFFVSYDANIEP